MFSCWISSFLFYVWTWQMTCLFFPQFWQLTSGTWSSRTTCYFPYSVHLWPWVCALQVHSTGSVHCPNESQCHARASTGKRLYRDLHSGYHSTIFGEEMLSQGRQGAAALMGKGRTHPWWGKWAHDLPVSETACKLVATSNSILVLHVCVRCIFT